MKKKQKKKNGNKETEFELCVNAMQEDCISKKN